MRVSLSTVVKTADKLSAESSGTPPSLDMAVRLSKVLFKNPTQKVITAVFHSLWPADVKVDTNWYEHNAYHLAANKHFLAEGVEIPLWDGSWEDTVVRCEGVQQIEPLKGKQRFMVWLKCFTGIPAGLTIKLPYTANALEYILAKYLHLSKLNLEAPEIAGMFFSCMVFEDAGGVRLNEFSVTPYMLKLNKELCDSRDNPRKWCHSTTPCYLCSKTVKECDLAVRRK